MSSLLVAASALRPPPVRAREEVGNMSLRMEEGVLLNGGRASATLSCNWWKAGVISDKLGQLAEGVSSEVLRTPPGFFLLLIVK